VYALAALEAALAAINARERATRFQCISMRLCSKSK
jgi:hypothetical protein